MTRDRVQEELGELGSVIVVDDGVVELETKLSKSVLQDRLQTKFYAMTGFREGPEYNVAQFRETAATAITGPRGEPTERDEHSHHE